MSSGAGKNLRYANFARLRMVTFWFLLCFFAEFPKTPSDADLIAHELSVSLTVTKLVSQKCHKCVMRLGVIMKS